MGCNDFGIIFVPLFPSFACTNAVATVPDDVVYATLLDASCFVLIDALSAFVGSMMGPTSGYYPLERRRGAGKLHAEALAPPAGGLADAGVGECVDVRGPDGELPPLHFHL